MTNKNKNDLMTAIDKNNLDEFNKLIEDGSDINYIDEKGRTPLIYASKKNQEEKNNEIIKELIKKGADLNRFDKYGNTAIIYFFLNFECSQISEDGENIILLMIEKGADINVKLKNNSFEFERNTDLLMMAAAVNSKKIVELLLKKNIAVNKNTALIYHSKFIAYSTPSDYFVLKKLIQAGAKLNGVIENLLCVNDTTGCNYLWGDRDFDLYVKKFIEIIIEHKKNEIIINKNEFEDYYYCYGFTSVDYFINELEILVDKLLCCNMYETLSYIINYIVDNKKINSILHNFVYNYINFVFEKYERLESNNYDLYYDVNKNFEDYINEKRQMCSYITVREIELKKSQDKFIELFIDIINKLISMGADINNVDNDKDSHNYGNSVIFNLFKRDIFFSIYEFNNIIEKALKFFDLKGADFNVKDNSGKTLLMIAPINCPIHIFEILLHNSNPDMTDNNGMTVLMHLISNIPVYEADNYKKLINEKIKLLIENSDLKLFDHNGNTALFYAIELLNFELLNILLNTNANLEIKNKNGDTPLIYAIKEMVKQNTFNYEIINALLIEKNILIRTGEKSIFEILNDNSNQLDSDSGFNIIYNNFYAKDKNGETAIMYAVKNNAVQIVEYLLKIYNTNYFKKKQFDLTFFDELILKSINNGNIEITSMLFEEIKNIKSNNIEKYIEVSKTHMEKYLKISEYFTKNYTCPKQVIK